MNAIVRARKRSHFWKTVLYLGAMLFLLGALGFSLLSWLGVLIAGVLFFILFSMGSRIPTEVIMRFYRARPLLTQEAPWLVEMTQALAIKAGLSHAPRLYLLPHAGINAFATGSHSNIAIALTRSIVTRFTEREVQGVLAHEISHLSNSDLDLNRLAMFTNRVTRGLAYMGRFLLILNLPLLAMGYQTIPWLAIILLLVAPFLSFLLQLAVSRTREFEADLAAVELTGDPEGLASALEKIEWLQSGGWPQWLLPGRRAQPPKWLSTHPQTRERVRRLRELKTEKNAIS
jgi:heat shock protein HtpX